MPNTALTTVSEFRHPELASTIALVGNQHMGTEPYMGSLRERLDIYESRGSVVHYEELRDATPGELEAMTRPVQRIYRELEILKEEVNTDTTNEGLVALDTIMTRESETWENHDLSTLELAERIYKRPTEYVSLSVFSEVMRTMEDSPKPGYDKFKNELKFAAGVLALMVGLEPSIVSHRNRVALRAVDSTLGETPDRDITLLWGQGHVPGLTRGLVRRGFQRTYITAYSPKQR